MWRRYGCRGGQDPREQGAGPPQRDCGRGRDALQASSAVSGASGGDGQSFLGRQSPVMAMGHQDVIPTRKVPQQDTANLQAVWSGWGLSGTRK